MTAADPEVVVNAYEAGVLSDKITVVYVPIKRTAYNDWAIDIPKEYNPYEPTPETIGVNVTHIRLEAYKSPAGKTIYAGYDDTIQTLVIGKEQWQR